MASRCKRSKRFISGQQALRTRRGICGAWAYFWSFLNHRAETLCAALLSRGLLYLMKGALSGSLEQGDKFAKSILSGGEEMWRNFLYKIKIHPPARLKMLG